MIAWFTRNGVAANLTMLLMVVGGRYLTLLYEEGTLSPVFTGYHSDSRSLFGSLA